MWKSQFISVILPTYNEKDAIAGCIGEFFDTGLVDEVLVVNNNAAAGTSIGIAICARWVSRYEARDVQGLDSIRDT